MSKSRLEKFLYALYSLDSSDLPTPLSRIEELYNCWVTGEEVYNFKPISRIEKYLMAILGVYGVDSLPNPMSRVEVLLHKLATGDDNLDGFDTFLSEHEELLAEIIRNGGAGGNIDIEYLLYTLSTKSNTLYNTAKKPIKSAILKGNTKYRDIDTGDILDTFDETKNLELVSVKMPVLTTSNEDGTKTNILSASEEVTLRGIGDVKDELDLLIGELTQRIGEVVLDGSQTLQPHSKVQGDTLMIKISDPSISFKQNSNLQESWDFSDMICDKELIAETPKWDANEWNESYNITLISSASSKPYNIDSFVLAIRKTYFNVQSIDEFKTWLTQNPLTIQYKLAKETIKTVDLSVVNQEGNSTELSTFNDITHVTLSSEGLIPEAELEVATKNEEVLNTMSLEMDDIFATQNDLQETSNTQSENVDATMIATTEIYEELL